MHFNIQITGAVIRKNTKLNFASIFVSLGIVSVFY